MGSFKGEAGGLMNEGSEEGCICFFIYFVLCIHFQTTSTTTESQSLVQFNNHLSLKDAELSYITAEVSSSFPLPCVSLSLSLSSFYSR